MGCGWASASRRLWPLRSWLLRLAWRPIRRARLIPAAPSPRTSPRPLRVKCSKAEAVVAVRRLGLRDVSPDYPVYKVLCGAFTGAGSQTMVALISGPDNVGMLYWAVFRWSGSEWQFLMKQRHAAVLAAAGSDIRETVSIYRPDDPRCCPSGGTRTRIWHWDGSQFAARHLEAPARRPMPSSRRAGTSSAGCAMTTRASSSVVRPSARRTTRCRWTPKVG